MFLEIRTCNLHSAILVKMQSEVLSKPTVNNKAEPQHSRATNTPTLCGVAARAWQMKCNCRCSAGCGDRPADDCSELQTSHRDRRAIVGDELLLC